VLRRWLLAFVAFVVVWDGVHALKPFADLNGPGTRGGLVSGFGGSQIENLTNRIGQRPAEFPERVRTFAFDRLPTLLGAKPVPDPVAPQGRAWIGWLLIAGAIAGLARLILLARFTRPPPAFIWYVLGVGLLASAMFVIARPATDSTQRYFLLALFFPVGLTSAWLLMEPNRAIRAALILVMAIWAAVSGLDNARLLSRYASGRESNTIRQLADALEARGLHVAEAGYWRAYKLTFLTGERVKIASNDYQRIDEYRRLADQEGDRLMRLAERPCPGGEAVAEHYLCPR
jgi:hypothetical protein